MGTTPPAVKAALAIWFVLLIAWLEWAFVAATGYYAGPIWYGRLFVWSTLTYPITVAGAFFFRRKLCSISLLPLLNVVGSLIGAHRVFAP
jgi:hypothetical protein